MSFQASLEFVPSSLFRSSYHTLSHNKRSSPLRLYGLSSPILTILNTSSVATNSLYVITQQNNAVATVVVASWTSVVQSFSYEGGRFADPKGDPLAVLVSGEERSVAICHEIVGEGLRPVRRELEGCVTKFATSGSDVFWLTGKASLLCANISSQDCGQLLSSDCVDFSISNSHLCVLKRRLVALHSRLDFSFVDAATLQDDAIGVRISSGPDVSVDVEYANGGVVCWEPRPARLAEGDTDDGGGGESEKAEDPAKELYLRILNR